MSPFEFIHRVNVVAMRAKLLVKNTAPKQYSNSYDALERDVTAHSD